MTAAENTHHDDVLTARWESVSNAAAEAIIADVYGIVGTANRLSSEKDDTFRVACPDGRSYTLKVANPKEDPSLLRFQDGALLHLERSAPQVPVPRLLRTVAGKNSHVLEMGDGAVRIVRLLSFLEGQLLHQTTTSISQCEHLGAAFAGIGRGLSAYSSILPAEKLLWDISYLPDLRRLLDSVESERRGAVSDVIDKFQRHIAPMAHVFRRQIIHNDLNPHNILVDPTDPHCITGIIDFGDMVEAALINDLAVAASYHLAETPWLEQLCALVEGYNHITPLRDEELAALPYLIKARLAMTVTITEWRSSQRPDERGYILRNHQTSWNGLQNINTLTESELTEVLFSSCRE